MRFMACEFEMTRRVEFAETDQAGIVHFTQFFRYMEATEHAFLRSLGLTVDSRRSGYGWPRVHAWCEYRKPLRFEEEFLVRLLVRAVRHKAIEYGFLFQRDGAEIARGGLTVVCVQEHQGQMRAAALPAAVRARLEAAPAHRWPGKD
jgi:YbgC/YbaW family acyl-CoA thioester hydrolase